MLAYHLFDHACIYGSINSIHMYTQIIIIIIIINQQQSMKGVSNLILLGCICAYILITLSISVCWS